VATLASNPQPLLRFLAPCLAGLMACSCATDHGQKPPSKAEVPRPLPEWGRAFDPDGDCKFIYVDDTLLIKVPGSARAHDLAAEIGLTNAPRVLREVKGDFTVEVRVDGQFAPGQKSTQHNRLAYNGAALVVMADPKNVVTLARALLQEPGQGPDYEIPDENYLTRVALQTTAKGPTPYANFEIRVNGRLKRMGLTGDHPLPKFGAVFLRLQRRGSQIMGAVSLDGILWDDLGAKEIPDTWPNELQTGVVAISTSADEFNPRFSNFHIGEGD